MSFLGVKVILFLVIPLIIKEKSNASALRSLLVFTTVGVRRLVRGFYATMRWALDNVGLGFTHQCLGFYLISTWVLFHIKWLLLLL